MFRSRRGLFPGNVIQWMVAIRFFSFPRAAGGRILRKMGEGRMSKPVAGTWRMPGFVALVMAIFMLPAGAASLNTPADSEINAAIDRKLAYDSPLPFNRINSKTEDGIVVLSGTAPNLLAKERAGGIAESVRGVRLVINALKVDPVQRSDAEILLDVESALLADPSVGSLSIQTMVKDGNVVLTGAVSAWALKGICASVAKGVRGVKEVENSINVTLPARPPDSDIADRVRRILERDVWVDEERIVVSVDEGRVVLSGTVNSAGEKSRAVEDSFIAGALSVDGDDVQVVFGAKHAKKGRKKNSPKTDREIVDDVEDALRLDPRVGPFKPVVTARAGEVILTGTVDNLKAKRAAARDARNTSGVMKVENLLRVRTWDPIPVNSLIHDVEQGLSRDPYLDRFDIGVHTLNGTVVLSGTVDSYFEKSHAEDIASRVKGVLVVKNALAVRFPDNTHYSWPHFDGEEAAYFNAPRDYSTWFDEAIQDRIESQLYWSPYVDQDRIRVGVRNRIATLAGTVSGWHAYRTATLSALAGGAVSVVNDLKVQ